MPGLPNEELSLPLEDSSPEYDGPVLQPRQPQNLQGLLRFAMEANQSQSTGDSDSSSSSFEPLDDERKNFLNEALQSMTIDVIKLMEDHIEKLKDIHDMGENDVFEKLQSFDCILDYIDNIDIANDFHKINGFSIFQPCLNCEYGEIRAKVCVLIAELAQNNPYIQEVICECTSVMKKLLEMISKDEVTEVRVKAMYAVSCITRESKIGYDTFKLNDGLLALRQVLEDGNSKLRTKACFMLCALVHMDSNILDEMVEKIFLPVITYALALPHQSYHEHLLALLLLIMEHSKIAKDAVIECKLSGQLNDAIRRNLRFVAGKEEYMEEEDSCRSLLQLLAP